MTGLRVGETLGLDDMDVDTHGTLLHIWHAKNGKNRSISITACTAERLADYRSLRDRLLHPLDPFLSRSLVMGAVASGEPIAQAHKLPKRS